MSNPSYKKKPSLLKRISRIVSRMMLLFFVISILSVIILRFCPIRFTYLMLSRYSTAVFENKTPVFEHQWVPISEISKHMPQAVVASEDNLFMSHRGFSIAQIKKAFEENKKGKRIRGGSTISQQTAKNVFLWPKRSYIRKGLEAYFTVLIELFWSKERIMEVYLNVIEMGNGIYGIESAAQHYFKKPAAKLSRYECARIAACLPNPRRFNPARPSPYIVRREGDILSLMKKISVVDFNKPSEKKVKTKSKNK